MQENAFGKLGDVDVNVTVSVGRCVKPFEEIMRLRVGDVIVLDKKKDDLVDVFVNDQYFIAGELVVANEKYSVRIVEFA